MSTQSEVPVLIVGGGIVGLSASLFLSHHGISATVIERYSGPSIHPRGRGLNTRSMEIFRHLGIDGLLREAGASLSASKGIHTGTTLREVIEKKPRTIGERKFPFLELFSGISPVSGTFVTQDKSEPVLVQVAEERGIDVRFNTEFIGLEQDDEGVTATLKDRKSGVSSTVHAKYLIAADGAKSSIRSKLNVPTLGRGTLGHLLNILFLADLKPLVEQREFSLCIIQRPEVNGLFTAINNDDRWVFHLAYDPTKGETPSDFPPDRCKELLRIALGMPDLDIDVKSILPWEPTVRVAERFQHGRVFLAGDAAHQMPPWGGQGANSGIADAHNLAWKLAAVLNGRAGETLLESYDAERMPAGLAAAQSSGSGVDENGIVSMKLSLTVVKAWMERAYLVSGHGYSYSSKAICTEDTSPFGGLTWKPWTFPSLSLSIDGRPGRRVPHLWVEHQGKRISTLDLSRTSFVLLAGADGKLWVEAAKEVSSAMGVDVVAYCAGSDGDLVLPTGQFEAAAGISSHGAILVRPDDFVMWRQRKQSTDCGAMLEQALKQVLCL